MKSISLRIDESILSQTDHLSEYVKSTRNNYINEAIAYYNKIQGQRLLAEKLRKESLLVRNDSMQVLSEFEQLWDNYEAV